MEEQEYGAYLVIKILSQNRIDFEKYECVPYNWVKAKDNYDNTTVVFGYPSEDRLNIRLRVIEHQPLDKTWPTLFGEVVFHTDSQEDAFRFLERKTGEHERNSDRMKDTSKQDDKKVEIKALNTVRIKPVKLSSKINNRPSKRKQSDEENILQINTTGKELDNTLELEILEAHDLIRTYASDLDNRETVSSSMPNSSHNTQKLDTTEILPNETDNAIEKTPLNNKNAVKITGRPRRKSTRQTRNLSQNYLEYLDEDIDSSVDSDYTPKIVYPDSNLGVSNSPKPKTPGQSVSNSLDQDININLMNDQVYSYCYNFNVEFNESYQKTMSILDNAADYLQKVIATHKDNVAAKAKQSLSLPTNKQPVAINSNMFSHPQPLLQERSSVSEEDSKWTLRYPDPGPGIIELLPHTGVYVSENGLNECKSTYSETTKFTRALLEEVFTDEALKKCSFTGISRKKFRKNSRGTCKPGLDFNARQTFVSYVLQYSFEMGWEKADAEIIMSCIRNRLQTLHRLG